MGEADRVAPLSRFSMPALQLHCPHCGGLFQIDPSLSGQHVGCPHCANVVAIPELPPSMMDGFGPPPPAPPELAATPPPSEEAFQLGCPTCGGPFQVTREMAGQHIACPHCQSLMLVPDLAPAASPPPGAAREGAVWEGAAWEGAAPFPTPAADYHPPPEAAPQMIALPAESVPVPASQARSQNFEELLPPVSGKRPREQGISAARPGPKAIDAEEELPPAARPKKKKQGARRPIPTEPPGASDLLPPAARPRSAERKSGNSPVDELLPPATAKRKDKPAAERPSAEQLSREAAPKRRRPGEAADGSILIPTEEGNYIALREPVKTISAGGREVELRRLTPEEKASRRLKRNLFVAVFGLLFLIVFLLVAGYLRG